MCSARTRATKSGEAPAGKPTMMRAERPTRSGRLAQGSNKPDKAPSVVKVVKRRRLGIFMSSSLFHGSLVQMRNGVLEFRHVDNKVLPRARRSGGSQGRPFL